MEQKKHNTINDIINELKRLQIEYGDVPVFAWNATADSEDWNSEPAWPFYNEKTNQVDF